jgi:peptide/nickel transport system permease protein
MHINYRQELLMDRWFMVGLILAGVLTAAALFGPVLAPYDPHDMSFPPLSAPSPKHFLGVNDGGMDIFTELLYGLRNTVFFGILAAVSGLCLGVILGLTSAWFGGWIDHALMHLANILLAIPAIMILILMASLFRPSPVVLALILAAMSWPTTAKACRAQALILKNSLHVQAARQMGAGSFYIISRHFIPELFPLYLIGFAAKARAAMFMEASLAFLGLFDPGRKSLGIMISYALKFYYLDVWWNWLMPPILCLSLLMTTVTFIAVSLEGVFDPRLREAW